MPIVCGTDFSARADGALRVAALVAARLGEPLRIVHVLDEIGAEMSYLEPIHDPLREALEERARQARALGADADAQLLPGSAARVLAGAAADVEAHLLVVAPGGLAGEAPAVLGSVATSLVRTSAVPVLAVREPASLEAWLGGASPLRVLVGADASESARTALRQVDLLRRAGRVALTVAHVASARREHDRLGLDGAPEDGRLHPEAARCLEAELRELADASADPSRADVVIVDGGDVADGLERLARERASDLVVVGAHRRAGADRLLHGSVSRDVARHVAANVLVAPVTPPDDSAVVRRVRSALVACDFSPASFYAIRHALAALPEGGTLHLVHVLPPPRARLVPDLGPAPVAAPSTARAHDEARQALGDAIPPYAGDRGVDVRVHVLEGAAAEQLCGAAERLDVDLICVGSARATGLAAALLGSVAQRLLARAHRPVLVVRPPPP